jgi:hypothetical protein
VVSVICVDFFRILNVGPSWLKFTHGCSFVTCVAFVGDPTSHEQLLVSGSGDATVETLLKSCALPSSCVWNDKKLMDFETGSAAHGFVITITRLAWTVYLIIFSMVILLIRCDCGTTKLENSWMCSTLLIFWWVYLQNWHSSSFFSNVIVTILCSWETIGCLGHGFEVIN